MTHRVEPHPDRPVLRPDVLPALVADLEDMLTTNPPTLGYEAVTRAKFLAELAYDMAAEITRLRSRE